MEKDLSAVSYRQGIAVAAELIGLEHSGYDRHDRSALRTKNPWDPYSKERYLWKPLDSVGDAMFIAIQLCLNVRIEDNYVAISDPHSGLEIAKRKFKDMEPNAKAKDLSICFALVAAACKLAQHNRQAQLAIQSIRNR